MRKSRRYSPPELKELNVTSSYADLMSGSLLIFSLIIFLLFIIMLLNQRQRGLNITNVPPIIVIPDNRAFRFPAGSAQLSPSLRRYIWQSLAETIVDNRTRYGVDTIEIIGHTDGQPNQRSGGNLDLLLEESAAANTLERLAPGSNADLGLMRALAIANELRKVQTERPELRGLRFHAYSAGQLYLTNGNFAPPNRNSEPSRRRIEVRFTRTGAKRVAE